MARPTARSGQWATYTANAGSVKWPAVMPHKPAMQPESQDPLQLWKACIRLAWLLRHAVHKRANAVLLADRCDKQVNALRRELDMYLAALEAVDPERFASVEQSRREWDDPIKALAFAEKEFL